MRKGMLLSKRFAESYKKRIYPPFFFKETQSFLEEAQKILLLNQDHAGKTDLQATVAWPATQRRHPYPAGPLARRGSCH
jgi:hypothetical protein